MRSRTVREMRPSARTPPVLLLALIVGAVLACAGPPASAPPPVPAVGTTESRDSPGSAPAEGQSTGAGAIDPAAASPELRAPAAEPAVGLAVGMRAPTFAVALLDGAPTTDADLRAQGKPYILYFYATW